MSAGSLATLRCNVISGSLNSNIYSWTHEGILLSNETSAMLNLMSVREQDAGNYTCDVRNADGVGSSSIIIGEAYCPHSKPFLL